MINFLRIIIFVFITFYTNLTLGQAWQWATKADGEWTQHGNDIAVDASGNSYVIGDFDKAITFYGRTKAQNITLQGSVDNFFTGNELDIFVAKYDPLGKIIWAKKLGDVDYESGSSIAVDADGNIYVTGFFTGKMLLGNKLLTSHNLNRMLFIAKYDTYGNIVWANQAVNETGESSGQQIKVDAVGNAYIIGNFSGKVNFDQKSLTSSGGGNVFVVKYNREGIAVWANAGIAATPGLMSGIDITVDREANCFITGSFYPDVSFGHITLNSPMDRNIFLVKYDTAGNVKWAKQAGGSGYDAGNALGADAAGNSYVAGFFSNNASFGSIKLSQTGEENSFLAKYDRDGNVQWVNKMISYGGSGINLAVNASGESFLAANILKLVPQDNHMVQNSVGLYIKKYASTGLLQWSKEAIGEISTVGDIALDPANACYVTGNFFSYFDFPVPTFDNFQLRGNLFDLYVAKLGEAGPVSFSTGSLSAGAFCPGTVLSVPFYGVENFPDNLTFEIQLSNASGSFAAPITIGAGTTSPLTAIIPQQIALGSGYRIRVAVAGNGFQLVSTDNGTNFSIIAAPNAPMVTSGIRCDVGPVTLTATGAIGSQTYRWYRVATGGMPVHGETSGIFVTQPISSTSYYYVAIVNEAGCEGPRTPVTASIELPPIVYAGQNQTVCLYTPAFSLSGFRPMGGIWVGPGLKAGGIFDPSQVGPGTYKLTYTVTTANCIVSQTKEITVEPEIQIEAVPDLYVCITTPAFPLESPMPGGGTWAGPGAQPNNFFDPVLAGPGKHTLTYIIQNGSCQYSISRLITVSESPVIIARAAETGCGTNQNQRGILPFKVAFTNTTQGTTAFLWDFGDGSSSTEMTPVHEYRKSGQFTVYLTISFGQNCSIKKQIANFTLEEKKEPNIFTPNKDGLNDTFAPRLTCLPVNLKVFNRYGNLVFQEANYQNTWEGDNLPDGTYYYHLTTATGLSWKGWVEIVR